LRLTSRGHDKCVEESKKWIQLFANTVLISGFPGCFSLASSQTLLHRSSQEDPETVPSSHENMAVGEKI